MEDYDEKIINLQKIEHISMAPKPSDDRVVQFPKLFVVNFDNLNNAFIPKIRLVSRADLIKTTKPYYDPVAGQVEFKMFYSI